MTILHWTLPARIAVRSVVRRRTLHRTFQNSSNGLDGIAATTTTTYYHAFKRGMSRVASTTRSRSYRNSTSSKAANGGLVSAAGKPEDMVMKETDFEDGSEVGQGVAVDEVTVSAEESEALEAVNNALDKIMEQEETADLVEEEVIEEPAPKGRNSGVEAVLDINRTVLGDFQRQSRLYYRDRQQDLSVIFKKRLNPLAFARAKPAILRKLQEYTEKKLIPECLKVDLIQNKHFYSAVCFKFLARDHIPSEAKYLNYWANFWGEGKIYEIINEDDYPDWVSIELISPHTNPDILSKEELQKQLQLENPGIFDDPLGRPQEGHPFASYMGNTNHSNDIIRVQLPPSAFWKVFQQNGLTLLGKHTHLKMKGWSNIEHNYKISRIWYASPHSIGRDNKDMEYNFIHKLGILEALKGMKDPNNLEERKGMIEIIKNITPPPPEPSDFMELSSPKKRIEGSRKPLRPMLRDPVSSNTPGRRFVRVKRVGGRILVQIVGEAEADKPKPRSTEKVLPFSEPKAPVLQRLALRGTSVPLNLKRTANSARPGLSQRLPPQTGFGFKRKLTPVVP